MADISFTVEKNLVVNNKEFRYSGIFLADEIFSQVNAALEEKGYTKQEKRAEEKVTPTGRKLYLELRPYKIVTNYINLMIKIRITLDNVTEHTEKKNGVPRKFDKGDVHVAFDAWSITNYEGRWGMKPLVYFLKGVFNKYIYTFPVESGATSELVEDTVHIYAQVKHLLQSYAGERPPLKTEEEVLEEMKKEITKEIEQGMFPEG